jgi:hypothetical protein
MPDAHPAMCLARYMLLWNNLSILENGCTYEVYKYYTQKRLYEIAKKLSYTSYLCHFANDLDRDEPSPAKALVLDDLNDKAPPVRQPQALKKKGSRKRKCNQNKYPKPCLKKRKPKHENVTKINTRNHV